MKDAAIVITLVVLFTECFGEHLPYPYTWECQDGRCVKQLTGPGDTAKQQSLNACMLRCNAYAGLWPRPKQIRINKDIAPIDSNGIITSVRTGTDKVKALYDKASNLLNEVISSFKASLPEVDKKSDEARGVRRLLEISVEMEAPEVDPLTLETDESYNLTISQTSDERVKVFISASTFYGLRHGLETMKQLIVYDFVSGGLVTLWEVEIYDRPAYPYRGILLDTARNYVSVPSLYRLIDAMAANKLNTFHWHITDSHSFPFQSRSFPQMAQYGAYTPEKVYTEKDISELVEYAFKHGIRVVPELDAPAHVGEGWQWADKDNATVCFAKEPWQQYCVEPPCGQINPTSEFAYEVLRGLYKDMEHLFHSDLFHMGGDEVNFNCWNTTEVITEWMSRNNISNDADGFHQLWDKFQTRALEMLDSVSGKPHKIVLWTSSLTEKGHVDKYLNNTRYIIQIWTTGKDEIIAELINKGFHVIFSNYDALYFDCGFGAWVGEGNNWCSPYIGWQKVYQNKPLEMLQQLNVDTSSERVRKLVLGQEATLWTEQADDQVIHQRLWPRAAAMAERLWADPEEGWQAAEHRFLYQRERMVAKGIPADAIEPLWCLQNQGHCYL